MGGPGEPRKCCCRSHSLSIISHSHCFSRLSRSAEKNLESKQSWETGVFHDMRKQCGCPRTQEPDAIPWFHAWVKVLSSSENRPGSHLFPTSFSDQRSEPSTVSAKLSLPEPIIVEYFFWKPIYFSKFGDKFLTIQKKKKKEVGGGGGNCLENSKTLQALPGEEFINWTFFMWNRCAVSVISQRCYQSYTPWSSLSGTIQFRKQGCIASTHNSHCEKN